MQKRLKVVSNMSFLVNGMLAVMTGTIITYLVDEYNITNAAAGRMVAAQSAGNLIMVLLSGFLIQLIGRKKSLFVFPTLFAVGFGGVAFVSNEIILCVLFAITGVGWGLCNNLINIIMMEQNNGDISVLYSTYAFGSFLAPFYVMAVTGFGLSWKVAVLTVVVMAALLIPGFAGTKADNPDGTAPEPGGRIGGKDFAFFKNPKYYVCLLLYFGYIGVEVAINSWTITFLTGQGLMKRSLAEIMLSVFWAVIIVVRLVCGRIFRRIPVKYLLVAQWSLTALCFVALLNVKTTVGAIVMVVLLAMVIGPICQYNAGNAEVFIKGKGFSGGFLFATGCLGSILLPMIVGNLTDSHGIFQGMCVVCGTMLCMIVVSVVNILVNRKDKKA